MRIDRSLISNTNTYSENDPKCIVVHNTDNFAAGADALAHARAQYNGNFQNMSASVKKTYTRAYFDAKTEAGRSRRLAWMIERLKQNLKPM